MPIALSAAWIAMVPVLTHWPYLAVCSAANLLAKAAACLPGKGWPPQRVLCRTSFRADASVFVAMGQLVNGFLRRGLPPVIASLPTRKFLLSSQILDVANFLTGAYEKATQSRG